MKYLLMIHVNPVALDALSEEERNAIFAEHDALDAELRASGEMVSSVALADPANSKVVRIREGVPAVTDGPYVEAKEFLAGYIMVDCESVDRALELAAKVPDARYLGVEVRPVMHFGGTEM